MLPFLLVLAILGAPERPRESPPPDRVAELFARASPEHKVAMLEAKIFDNPDSPYADAVSSAKAILRGLENADIPSIRAMAQRLAADMEPSKPATAAVEVTAPRAEPEIAGELQAIEDLLTGTEVERRQGLDRLHQLLRRLRR